MPEVLLTDPTATIAANADEMITPEVDVDSVILRSLPKTKVKFDVRANLLDCRVRETIKGAPTFTLIIHDPEWKLVTSKHLYRENKKGDRVLRNFEVRVDRRRYRLTAMDWDDASEGSGADVTLTFEHIIVDLLRDHNKPKKASRSKVTRAQFVKAFADEIQSFDIDFVCPELNVRQPVRGAAKPEKQERHDANRDPGLDRTAGITVKGAKATSSQLNNIEDVLQEGTRQGASTKLLICSIMCITQESGATTSATNGVHVGLFQQDPAYWPATRDATKDAKAFFAKGKKIDAANPNLSYDQLIEAVQRSGQGELYAPWKKEATKTVRAFKGTGTETRSYYKQYRFQRGRKGARENSWKCSQRLAEEVNWRSFVTGVNKWYFISETTLFKSRVRMTVDRKSGAYLNSQGNIDRGKKYNRITLTVLTKKWVAPAGSIVRVDGFGAADGRWLVEEIERSIFSQQATITLKKPSKQKKEPRSDLVTKEVDVQEHPGGVASPLDHILNSGNGYSGSHDGVDLICSANAVLYAICDAEVIDVRAGGWWGKNPTGDVSKGDGIIQLKCLINKGPFKRGMHFGYGHAEHARVKVGDKVKGGQPIGRAGFANAWHTHFMVNDGTTDQGIGDRDPMPFVNFAIRHAGDKTEPDRTEPEPTTGMTNPDNHPSWGD